MCCKWNDLYIISTEFWVSLLINSDKGWGYLKRGKYRMCWEQVRCNFRGSMRLAFTWGNSGLPATDQQLTGVLMSWESVLGTPGRKASSAQRQNHTGGKHLLSPAAKCTRTCFLPPGICEGRAINSKEESPREGNRDQLMFLLLIRNKF